MEGSHFEGSPSPVNYSHAARCLLQLPLGAQSANQNAAFARHCEATQPLERRGARLWGIWGNPGMIYLKLQCTQ